MPPAKRLSPPLQVERLDNGRRRLLRDLVIDVGADLGLGNSITGFTVSDDQTTVVTVPAGFDTDFSSIPGFARSLYRFDEVDLAGTCHDYAYWIGAPRRPADELWRLIAISGDAHISEWKARLGWLALRAFGWIPYRDHVRRRKVRQMSGETVADCPD